ncbi:hypothetical protein ABID14_001265 [Peptoniphilus olsenii]|uniref:Uncharacterized protein n=1 Tax=Peptoniphilus olsenii TaxID=411570 RepID=A0ABV2JA47_9FIRM
MIDDDANRRDVIVYYGNNDETIEELIQNINEYEKIMMEIFY